MMEHTKRLQDLSAVVSEAADALETSWGLPYWFYTDPRVYELDLRSIFHREWQYVGPAAQVAEPGDVLIGQAGDVPVVVTRDPAGELHGFVNVCRHRGYKVAGKNARNCKRLVCRYHAWSYWLNGELAAAPGSEDEPGFPKEDLSLRRVAVDVWGDAVFVNADAQAKTFLESYGNLTEIAVGGLTLESGHYSFVRECVHDVPSNWKLWYDNFVECYHCDNIHRGSFASAYEASPESTEIHYGERFMFSRFAPKGRATGTALRADNYRSANIFPGLLYLQQDGLMILSQMRPTAPERTCQLVHYFAEEGTDPKQVEDWIDLWKRTFTEDGDATAVQQEGLRVGMVERNRLLEPKEAPLLFFNRLIVDAYRTYLDAPPAAAQAAE